MTQAWHRVLALALTGEEVALADVDRPDVTAALAELAAVGWTRDRIAAQAAQAHASEQPWPHPVQPAARADLGAAAFHAMLADAKRRLDVDQPEVLSVARRPLDADERRLSADLPPHHGHVG